MAEFTYMRKKKGWFSWEYRLLASYDVVVDLPCPRVFSHLFLVLAPTLDGKTLVHVEKSFSWDGATRAPDYHTMIKGTLVHDIVLDYAEAIMFVWECPYITVRHWADQAFKEVNATEKTPWILNRIYYKFVHVYGHIKSLLKG